LIRLKNVELLQRYQIAKDEWPKLTTRPAKIGSAGSAMNQEKLLGCRLEAFRVNLPNSRLGNGSTNLQNKQLSKFILNYLHWLWIHYSSEE
jgi:hypothetical protein